MSIAIKPGAVRKSFVIGLLGCLLAAPAFAWAQARSTGIVVFGDSLSDPGNLFALKKVNNIPPEYLVDQLLIPDAPYAKGGHHLSNGATWVEQLARSLGLAPNAGPAFRDASPRATNYAVAGARAYDDGKNVNLSAQVGRFLQDFGAAPSDALYVIEIGGSDVRDALANQDPTIIAQGLGAIGGSISALYQAGARKFLVWNVPNVALIPSIRALETQFPGIGAAAQMLSQGFNANLAGVLTMLEASLPGIQIARFDAFAAINNIYADPAAFGLTEVNAPCITPNVPPFSCTNPDEYLFWDGIHPTKAVHEIVAQQVMQLLAQ